MTPSQLKKLRESTGLSPSGAAYIVHVRERTWRRYESGERSIPDGVVHLFCLQNNIDYPPSINS